MGYTVHHLRNGFLNFSYQNMYQLIIDSNIFVKYLLYLKIWKVCQTINKFLKIDNLNLLSQVGIKLFRLGFLRELQHKKKFLLISFFTELFTYIK